MSCPNPVPTFIISPENALPLILAGELVHAHDLELRGLHDSHFYLLEKELNNPKDTLHAKMGIPKVQILGMEGFLYSPKAVFAFMELACDEGREDDDEEMESAS